MTQPNKRKRWIDNDKPETKELEYRDLPKKMYKIEQKEIEIKGADKKTYKVVEEIKTEIDIDEILQESGKVWKATIDQIIANKIKETENNNGNE